MFLQVVMRFFIFILCLTTVPLRAADLSGQITDIGTGKPIAGVTIRIVKSNWITQTNSEGKFLFIDLPKGSIQLHISHVAYQAFTKDILLSEQAVEVSISLESTILQLQEISITADPMGQNNIHKNPSFATVITRDSFEDRKTSLPDILAETTGVQVKNLGGLGAFSTISLRGSSAEQVEVYLDGILLNAASGGGVDLSNLPLAQIGQIEVYRGASASGNGLGGTVHIRTRQNKRTFSHSARASWGNFDTRTLNGMVTKRTPKTTFLLVADYASSDNDFKFHDDNGTEYNTNDDTFTNRQNNRHQSVNLLGKWHYTFDTDHTLTIQESLLWKKQGIPGISNNQSQQAYLTNFRSLTEIVLNHTQILTNVSANQSFYFTHTQESFVDRQGEIGVGRQDNTYRTHTSGWQGRVQTLLFAKHALTTILGVRRETYKPTAHLQSVAQLFDSQRWTLSFRAGADWTLPIGVLSTSLDMRQVRSSFTGANPFSFSPLAPDSANTRNLYGLRSGLRINLTPNLIFKANLGRTQRAPSFYELFGNRGGVVGNENLRPERGLAWDAGMRYHTNTTTIESVFFDHHYDDLIQFVQTSQATSRPENIGQARVWGIEITVQKELWKYFGISSNYTFQRTKDQSTIPHLNGNALPNRPPHKLFARIKGGIQRITAFYDYTFEDGNFLDQSNRRPLASRHIHNAGMNIKITKQIQFGLEAKNLKNTQIADTWGYPLPGRAFFISVQEQF